MIELLKQISGSLKSKINACVPRQAVPYESTSHEINDFLHGVALEHLDEEVGVNAL